ncbi:MAG: AMP-binding protein, partial [Burkholderiales bacterium]
MQSPLAVLQRYPLHGSTLGGLLASRVREGTARTLLWYEGREIGYADFAHRVEAAAHALAARGIGAGDRVGAMAGNSADYVVLLFALARLGAILVPVNPEFGPGEAGYILQHAEVSAVAVVPAALETARAAVQPLTLPAWFFMLEGESEGVPRLDELIKASPPHALPPEPAPEAICLMLYTSGTTGFPKGVMHSQRSFVMAGEGFVARMWLQPEDRLLCVLPMFHINALFYTIAGTFAAGASVALMPRFSASQFWNAAAAAGATQVNIIAAVGNILARRPRSEFDPEHRLRVVYGAPISPDLERVFREEFGVPMLIEGYGMTEIPGACNNPYDG